jgi:hypothetical protein
LESEDLSAAVAMTTNHGTLVLSPNGGFTYTPAPHFHGQDSFSYRAEDVHGASAPITVAIDVVLLGQRDLSFGGGDGQVSFASGVTVTSTTGSALQRDGKTVMAGAAKPVAQSDGDFWLARFNANGTRDTAFGTAGSVFTEFAGFDDAVHAVAMLEVDANPAHDLIVAVGQAHNSAGPIDTDLALAVYRLDGSLVVQRRETAPTGPSTSGGYDYGLGVATQSPDTIAVAGTSSGKAIVDLYTLTNTLTTPTLSAAQPFVFPNGSNDIGSSVAFMNNMAGQPCVVMGLSVLIGAGRFATVARFRRDTAALDTTYYTTGYSHLNGNMNLNQNISVGTVPSDPATVLVAVPDAGQNWIIWGSHAQGVDGNGAEQLGSISYFINMGEATGMTGLAIDPVSHGAVVVGWTGTSYKVVRMESWQSTDPDFGKFGLITVDAAFGPSLQPAVRPDRHILVPGASSGIMQLLSLDGDDEAPAAVTGLLVTPTDGGVDVSWSPSPEADVVDYELCLTAEPVLTDDCAAVASTNTHQLLLSSLTNGTAYRVGVGAVDSTSNRSPIASVAVTPRIPTVLSQSPATALSTKYGLQTTFSATLRRSDTNAVLSGQPVTLEARRSGTVTYAQVAGPVLTTGAGVATITTAAAFSGAYRLRYAGTQTVAAATSASRAVTVAATVSAAISTTTAPLGYPLRITGTVRPAHSTPKLQLQRYTSSWQTIATTTPTSTGSYTFNLTPSTTGSYAYRVRFPGDTDHAAGVSTTQRVTVYDVTLTTVHPTSPEYVDLRNLGTKTVAIGGWRLSSASTGRSVVLPAYRLAAGATVRMFVGKGGATAKTIYLQQTAALLADTHDTLRLRDPAKHIACTRGY